MPKIASLLAWMIAVPLWSQLIVHQPLDGPLAVSGELAELRNHHFHSGIDLRTGGVTGKPVYAVADGWVRRIVVRPDGYGWALYIDHPSGFTTVYGHLESFSDEIWQFTESEARRRGSYRLDLYPPKGMLSVTAGTVIGLSGNTGSSGGPHLHFEVRDLASEEILDPAAHGLDIPIDPNRPKLWAFSDGRWRPAGDSVSVASWYDLAVTLPEQDFEVLVSDSLRTTWSLKRWSFDVQRGADAGLALGLHQQQGVRGFLIHPTPTQPAPGWRHNLDFPRASGRYTVAIRSGSARIWSGVVRVREFENRVPQPAATLRDGAVTLHLPARAFAWKQNLTLKSEERSIRVAPDVAAIKPVHFDWVPNGIHDSLWDKTYLAVRDGRGSAKIPGIRTSDGAIRYTSKTCGSAEIRIDTEGPNCRFIRKTPSGSVLLHVHDELDVEVVRAQINGQWCWAYLDAKTNTLAVHVGDTVGTLDVHVQDELGNLTTFTTIL
ncbi:MAG: M23 family metallopeptidase [Schleiferiaceae bacterium]